MGRKPKLAAIGHNNLAAARLRAFCERIERLQEEIAERRQCIGDIKGEVKSAGFDIRTFNQMLRERLLSSEELEEQVALAEIYRKALGLLSDTPLGTAALKRLSPETPPPADPAEGAPPDAVAPSGLSPEQNRGSPRRRRTGAGARRESHGESASVRRSAPRSLGCRLVHQRRQRRHGHS